MAIKKIKRPNPKWDIILEKLKDFFFKFIKKSKKLFSKRRKENNPCIKPRNKPKQGNCLLCFEKSKQKNKEKLLGF